MFYASAEVTCRLVLLQHSFIWSASINAVCGTGFEWVCLSASQSICYLSVIQCVGRLSVTIYLSVVCKYGQLYSCYHSVCMYGYVYACLALCLALVTLSSRRTKVTPDRSLLAVSSKEVLNTIYSNYAKSAHISLTTQQP